MTMTRTAPSPGPDQHFGVPAHLVASGINGRQVARALCEPPTQVWSPTPPPEQGCPADVGPDYRAGVPRAGWRSNDRHRCHRLSVCHRHRSSSRAGSRPLARIGTCVRPRRVERRRLHVHPSGQLTRRSPTLRLVSKRTKRVHRGYRTPDARFAESPANPRRAQLGRSPRRPSHARHAVRSAKDARVGDERGPRDPATPTSSSIARAASAVTHGVAGSCWWNRSTPEDPAGNRFQTASPKTAGCSGRSMAHGKPRGLTDAGGGGSKDGVAGKRVCELPQPPGMRRSRRRGS